MDVGFVHIGMMKTASTYMQNLWLREESYSLIWKKNIEFIKQVEKVIKEDDLKKNIDLNIKLENHHKDQTVIISHEGYSTGFMNDINFQNRIPEFMDYSSRILGELSNSLLIVVREPTSWIRSMYIQSIKQGWSGWAQDFIYKQLELLNYSLDLEFIYKCYNRYFDNIFIVPFEILKEDENYFWKVISKNLDVPFVKQRMSKVNQSLDLKRVFMLSKLNQMSAVLLNTLISSKEYKNMQEKNKLVNVYSNHGKWVHRRFIEYANEKELNHIYQLFNKPKIPDDFLKFSLPEKLLNTINTKYIKFLSEHIDEKYVELYKKEVDNFN